MYYPFVRKALFQLDPERAHELTFQQLRRITGTPLEALVRQKVPAKPVTCMGLTFKNPLGLAAGLDKDGECIDALGAMRVAERLCRVVAASPAMVDGQPLSFTVSVGVAMLHEADQAHDEAYSRADEALYAAKHGGRNRAVLARERDTAPPSFEGGAVSVSPG